MTDDRIAYTREDIPFLQAQLKEAGRDCAVAEKNHMDADFELSRVRQQLAAKDAEIERLREAQRCPIFEGKRLDNGETVWGGSFVQFLDDGVRTAYIPKYGEKCSCEHDDADNILAFEHGTFYRVGLDSVRIRTLPAPPEKGE